MGRSETMCGEASHYRSDAVEAWSCCAPPRRPASATSMKLARVNA